MTFSFLDVLQFLVEKNIFLVISYQDYDKKRVSKKGLDGNPLYLLPFDNYKNSYSRK